MFVHISFNFAGADFLALSVLGARLSESANHGLLLRLENTEVAENISKAERSRRLEDC